MKELILVLILILIIYKNNENFLIEEKFYNQYFQKFKLAVLDNNFTGQEIEFSDYKSGSILNYLINLNLNSPIHNYDNDSLRNYLINICYVNDNELVNSIINNLNYFLKKEFDNNIDIKGDIKISNYKILLLNLMRSKFVNYIRKNIVEINKFGSSILLLDEIFYLLTTNKEFYLENKRVKFKDVNISYLTEKGLVNLLTIKDYDDMDIMLNGIDIFLINHLKKNFNKEHLSILDFNFNEVRNLYFTGNKIDYDFTLVLC